MVAKFVNDLEPNWSLEGLTNLIYEIPKKPNLDEAQTKAAQRDFFKIIYRLLTDSETGPRLPIFLLSIGVEKAKHLLKG